MQRSQFKVFFKYILFQVYGCFSCIDVFVPYIGMLGTYEDLKRAWNPLDLEL